MKNIKRKLIVLAISSIAIFNLVGCSTIEEVNEAKANADKTMELTKETVDNIVAVDVPSIQTDGTNLSIITDKRTGVQYIRSYKGGIQVIVDKDGKPLTIDVKGDK